MTTDPQWDTRWRNEAYYQDQHYDSMQAPQLPGPAAMSPAPPSAIDSYAKPWDGMSRVEANHHQGQGLPRMIESYTDASTYRFRPHERHHSPRRGSVTSSPPRQDLTGPWHSLPLETHAHQRQITDAPLTLHIPQTPGKYKTFLSDGSKSHGRQCRSSKVFVLIMFAVMTDLPKISTTYSANSVNVSESQTYSSAQSLRTQQTTSLPSFASFQEHASRTDDPDEVEIAPMSSRLSCYLCTKLKPMVRDVATAVAELDENVQTYCHRSITRTLDFPKDSPVRAVQWVLERLSQAKGDLQDVARRTPSAYYSAQVPTAFPGMPSRHTSPSTSLKRPADRWDQDDFPVPKRPRSGASPDDMYRTTSGPASHDVRRGSIDFVTRSPPPTESVPGSAYPRTGSPGLSGRPHRTLPSPSSMAYPPSAAPSLALLTTQSVGSPPTSYQPTVSIHSTSTSSVTSAHIADLQHQVTLKSLSLQTLQSEYASLLQKLQRERVKSQTIEKKTNVADQEVNDLTGKNEELIEQLKSLETQLEESERKRETERIESAREKEQWLRMLEMGGRLHSKNAEEKRKLTEEKTRLSLRVDAFEEENSVRFQRMNRNSTPNLEAGELQKKASEGSASLSGLASVATSIGSVGDASNDVDSLKSEIAVLNSKIEILRFSLEETKRRNHDLGERTQEIVHRNSEIGSAIDRALQDGALTAKTKRIEAKQHHKAGSGRSTPARQKPNWSPKLMPTVYPPSSVPTSAKFPDPRESRNTSSTSSSTIASFARAISPGPEELGFHVTPSTASPEELIRALGPLPASFPGVQFGTSSFAHSSESSQRDGGGEQLGKLRMPNPWLGMVPTGHSEEGRDTHVGSFRPLTHHVPSPYASVGQIADYTETSPHSCYSSPGPVMDYTSPNSSRSGSGPSIAEESSRPAEDNYTVPALASGPSLFATGPPQSLDTTRSSGAVAAMPPPPRPTDLDSTAGRGITKH